MSRRGSEDDLDSLNLLLDTVCNMFGIFIFSALVVAIMSVTRTTQVVAESSPRSASAEIVQQLESARASVDGLNEQLERSRTSRGQVFSERAKQAAERRREAESAVEARRQTKRQYEEAIENLDQFLAGLPVAVARLRDEVASLEDAVRRAKAVKEVEARTPLRRALEGRVPVQVVLHDGKAYVLNAWWDHVGPAHHPCDIWCDWNPAAVDPDPRLSECRVVSCIRGGSIEIHRIARLRDDGGIPARSPEALASDANWKRFLDSLDPTKHVVSIRSTFTGFGAFGAVRGSIVSRGIPYNAEPVRLDPFYRDSIIEGTPIGQ